MTISTPVPGHSASPRLAPLRRPGLRIDRSTVWLLLALGALVLLRLVAMAWLPLMDTTEARYAEIGRKMLELRDWITPWHDYGVPFWAKPPLSFWLSAASMSLFGVGEFAVRLPHFLCMVAIALISARLATTRDDAAPLATVGLLGGSALGFIAAGAVMTDAALVIGTTLAMSAFWLSLHGPRERVASEHRLLVAALAIGLLAKGPLVLVLVVLPVGAWAIATGNVRRVLHALPWTWGTAATLVAAGWWYAAAELKTPGFIDYFIVGEHWHRFVTPGWSGDRYGFAHAFAPGTIWVFALASMMPWPLVLLGASFSRRQADASVTPPGADQRSWTIYLLCWSLAPLVFFTAARNIILPYALPALPALALLGAGWLHRRVGAPRSNGWIAAGIAVSVATTLGLGLHAASNGTIAGGSAKAVVQAWEAQRRAGEPIVFAMSRLYSASFYSTGRAQFADSASEAAHRIAATGGFIVLRADDRADVAQLSCVTRRTTVGPFELLHLASARDALTACPRHVEGPDANRPHRVADLPPAAS